jgi:hypothetical protein
VSATFVCFALLSGLPGAPEWLSTRVFACGIAAVGLLILALIMRGLQKVITFLVVGLIALGGYWFVQDQRPPGAKVMPAELAAELERMATRGLEHPDAKAAWETVRKEWERLTGDARARLAAGGDPARSAVARRIDAKAVELRRQGKKAAADELARLREKVAPEG